MLIDECFQLGYIVKTHGLKGHVIAQLDCDDPYNYEKMESVLLEQSGVLIPFFITSIQIQGNKAHMSIDGIDSPAKAQEITGSAIYLPLTQLPPLGKDGYYYHDLIGYSLYDKQNLIGTITAIYQPSYQYIAAVSISEKEILIPLVDEFIVHVDKDQKSIQTDLPAGLVDVFLEEKP